MVSSALIAFPPLFLTPYCRSHTLVLVASCAAAGCTTRHQHQGASRRTRREVLNYYLFLSSNLSANSMKYSMDCELLSASLLTAFSTGIPIKSFFTGTSVFLPLSVRGTS